MNKAKTVQLILTLSLLALIFANAHVWYTRIDFSRDKTFTLSDYTALLTNSLTEKLVITYYASDKLKTLYPEVVDVREFLYAYGRLNKAQIRVTQSDPQKNESRLNALGIEAQQIQTVNNNETSFVTVYSAVTIEYCGKTEVIPFVLSTKSLEFDLNTKIRLLLGDEKRTALILLGNELSLSNDYSYLVPWLESAGFNCKEIASNELETAPVTEVLLVLGDSSLQSEDCLHIENFVMRGGNAAFCVGANTVNAFTDWEAKKSENNRLIKLLDCWGVAVKSELVTDISNYRLVMQSFTDESSTQVRNEYINYPFWIVTQYANVNAQSPLSSSFAGLELYWPSPLVLFDEETEDNSIQSVVSTTAEAALMGEPFDTDPFRNRGALRGEKNGSFPLAATIEGRVNGFYTVGKSEKVRLFVIGDQYCASNMIEYTNSPHNLDFIASVMLWLSREDDMMSIKTKGMRTTALTRIGDDEVFAAQKNKALFWCFVFPVPVVFALAFALTLKRKERRT